MKFEIRRNIYHDQAVCVVCGKKPHYIFKPLIKDKRAEAPIASFVCPSCIHLYFAINEELFEIEEETRIRMANSMERINGKIFALKHKEY